MRLPTTYFRLSTPSKKKLASHRIRGPYMTFKLQNAARPLPVVPVCSTLLLALTLISSPKGAAPQRTVTLINPEQITEVHGGAGMRITRLVSSAAGLLAVAETGRSAELIRYDGKGKE